MLHRCRDRDPKTGDYLETYTELELRSGAACKRCGTIVLAGKAGDPHRCDGRPGSSHDVSTCARCEVPP